jgi:hypothetical protein
MGDLREAPRLNDQSSRVSILGVGTSKDRCLDRSNPIQAPNPYRYAKSRIFAEPGWIARSWPFPKDFERFSKPVYCFSVMSDLGSCRRLLDCVYTLLRGIATGKREQLHPPKKSFILCHVASFSFGPSNAALKTLTLKCNEFIFTNRIEVVPVEICQQ